MTPEEGLKLFNEVKRIRDTKIDNDIDAINLIKYIIKQEVQLYIPLRYLIKCYNNSSYVKCINKLNELTNGKIEKYNLGKYITSNNNILVNNYYFGTFYKKPEFNGDYKIIASDIKSDYITQLLLGDSTKYKHIIHVLSKRPLTKSEYKNLLRSNPYLKEFVNAALGKTIENVYNKCFQEYTNRYIVLELSEFLADIY